jgi:hypothetical protein
MTFNPNPPGGPIPKEMGLVADEYALTRAFRLALEKMVMPVQQRESELREHMIANLEKSRGDGGNTGAAGKLYRVQIRDKATPRVTDWAAVHAFVAANNRFDLLQKRLSDTAVLEMFDNNEPPPGVDRILLPDVSVTKI